MTYGRSRRSRSQHSASSASYARGAAGNGPEVGGVDLVPDDDVTDLRDPREDVVKELRVVAALDVVEGGLLGAAVHGEHHALAAGDHRRRAMEVDAHLPGRPVLAASPRDRQPDGVDAEVAVRGQEPVGPRPPLGRVVVEADDQLSLGGLCGRSRSVRGDYRRARDHRPNDRRPPQGRGTLSPRASASQATTVQLSNKTSSAASGRLNGVAM